MNWKRALKLAFAGLGILALLVSVTVVFLAHSQRFHEFLLAKIEQKATESIGGQVSIQNYVFHFRSLSADVYGLVVRGKERTPDPPLLSIDRLFVDVRIVSLFKKEVDLREIVVEHPAIHLISYPDGTLNLPTPPKKENSGSTNLFDLGIQHVLLSKGEIYFDQRKQDLTADLHNLRTELSYKTLNDRYEGTLTYDNGQIKVAGSNPLTHSMDAKMLFDRNHAELQSAELKVGASQLFLRANLDNYASPKLSGDYRLVTHPQDFKDILQNSTLPVGQVTMEGKLKYDSSDRRPLLRAVVAEGTVSSSELQVTNPQVRLNIQAIRGSFLLAGAKFAATLHAGVLAGNLSATIDMLNLDTAPSSTMKASLTGISIVELRSAIRTPNMKDTPVTGKIDAYAEGGWKGDINTLVANADLTLKAAVAQKQRGGRLVPVNGAAHVNYRAASGIVGVRDTVFRTPQSSVSLQGQISQHSDLKIAARTNDVGELNALAASFRTARTGSEEGRNLYVASGPAVLNATLTGDMKRPEIAGILNAHDLTIQGDPWKTMDAKFQAGPSGVVLSRASFALAERGQIDLSARIPLHNWSYRPADIVQANLRVRQMPLRSLQHIAGVQYPVSGILGGDIVFKGSQLDPSGTGELNVTQAEAYGQKIQGLGIRFQAANRTINSDLSLRTPAGNISATAWFRPDTRAYEVHMTTPGVALAALDAVRARNLPIEGTLLIKADGAGTIDNPQLRSSVDIPHLQVRDTVVQSVKSNLLLANHRANLDLSSDFASSYIQGRGTVDLTGDYPADIALDTRAIPIETLMALYKPLPNREVHGQIELHATARGPLKDRNRMEAHISIPVLRAAYQELQLANVQPIRADYQNAVLKIQPSEIAGTGTSLRFAGSVPIASDQSATVNLVGNVDMQIVRLFNPDVQSRGNIALDLRANRDGGKLGVGGQIRLNKIAFATLASPMGVQNLNGVLAVEDNQVRITDLQGQTGGGTISAGGSVTYRPQLAMNVSLQAKGVRIRYPDGVRAVIDSDLALSGSQQDSTLNGRVLLNSLGFTSDFDLAQFMGQFSGSPTSAPSPGIAQNLKLNIALQSTSDLQLVSSELSLEGQVNLKVQGTAAQPVIVGRTTLSNGDIFFMNRRYRLERGILDFVNPNETQPNVNILITTIVNQYNLSLTLLGPVDRLRTTYVSDPPLPPVDIINLIARGSTAEETTPTNFDANSVLAQGLASQVSSRLQKFAGISSLQIDPLVGGSNQNPGARIAIQQRVTRNFLFTFSTDVTNAANEVVQAEYQLNPRWSVSAQRDETGGYALDAKYRRVF